MEEALPSCMCLLFSLSNIFFHVRSIVPGLCMQTMLSVQINVMYNILQGQTIQNKITLQIFQRKKIYCPPQLDHASPTLPRKTRTNKHLETI